MAIPSKRSDSGDVLIDFLLYRQGPGSTAPKLRLVREEESPDQGPGSAVGDEPISNDESRWSSIFLAHRQAAQKTADRMGSRAYRAAIRRREVRTIGPMLTGLAEHADRGDFSTFVHPIVQEIRGLLERLADAPREGNTREILRRLRDSFLDGGWNRYREPAARSAAIATLDFLAEAEAVDKADVARLSHAMLGGGLNPLNIPLFEVDEDLGEADGDEEADQISD